MDESANDPNASGRPLSGQWLIATQPDGELLAAECRFESDRTIAFADSGPKNRLRNEDQLHALMAELREVHDAGDEILPARLGHALFHLARIAEDERREMQPPFRALVLFESGDQVACGCVGDRLPRVFLGQSEWQTKWVPVGVAEGRSFAFVLPLERAQGLGIQWPGLGESPSDVEADWVVDSVAEEVEEEVPTHKNRFFDWLDRVVAGAKSEPTPESEQRLEADDPEANETEIEDPPYDEIEIDDLTYAEAEIDDLPHDEAEIDDLTYEEAEIDDPPHDETEVDDLPHDETEVDDLPHDETEVEEAPEQVKMSRKDPKRSDSTPSPAAPFTMPKAHEDERHIGPVSPPSESFAMPKAHLEPPEAAPIDADPAVSASPSFMMPKLPRDLSGEPKAASIPAEASPAPKAVAAPQSFSMPKLPSEAPPNKPVAPQPTRGRSRPGRRRKIAAPAKPGVTPVAEESPTVVPQHQEPPAFERTDLAAEATREPLQNSAEPEPSASHEMEPEPIAAKEPPASAPPEMEPEPKVVEESPPLASKGLELESNAPQPRQIEYPPAEVERPGAWSTQHPESVVAEEPQTPAPATAPRPRDLGPFVAKRRQALARRKAAQVAATGAPESAPAEESAPVEEELALAGVIAAAPRSRAERRHPVERTPLKPSWPSESEVKRTQRPFWHRRSLYIIIAGLFGIGWFFGRVQMGASGAQKPEAVWASWLPGPGTFRCEVQSDPPGALVVVDGKDTGQKTPADLRLEPGEHQVTVTLLELGSQSVTVKGQRGKRVQVDVPLRGALRVKAADANTPVTIWVDGSPRGAAPLMIEHLEPGPHEIQFTAPGLTPWGQTVNLRVKETTEIVARPFRTPSTGLIEVRASLTDDRGNEGLKGAAIWVDGKQAGFTPLTLELPGGPHSIRAAYRGEESSVQLIDLPGGNQRFANFQFGTGIDRPSVSLVAGGGTLPRDRASVVSAAVEDVSLAELREMWLHVRTPEGNWRRYPMTLLESPEGVVGVTVFPVTALDQRGRAPSYVSAMTVMGDEYFTEVQNPDESKGWKVRKSGAAGEVP